MKWPVDEPFSALPHPQGGRWSWWQSPQFDGKQHGGGFPCTVVFHMIDSLTFANWWWIRLSMKTGRNHITHLQTTQREQKMSVQGNPGLKRWVHLAAEAVACKHENVNWRHAASHSEGMDEEQGWRAGMTTGSSSGSVWNSDAYLNCLCIYFMVTMLVVHNMLMNKKAEESSKTIRIKSVRKKKNVQYVQCSGS